MRHQTIAAADFYAYFASWAKDHSAWSSRDLWWACKYDQAKYPYASHLRLTWDEGSIVGYRLCDHDDTALASDGITERTMEWVDSNWLAIGVAHHTTTDFVYVTKLVDLPDPKLGRVELKVDVYEFAADLLAVRLSSNGDTLLSYKILDAKKAPCPNASYWRLAYVRRPRSL